MSIHSIYLVSDLEGSDNGDPLTGLFIAASCNSRFSLGRYTRSYGTVSSIGLLGQNCKPYMVVHYTFSIHFSSNPTMAPSS